MKNIIIVKIEVQLCQLGAKHLVCCLPSHIHREFMKFFAGKWF